MTIIFGLKNKSYQESIASVFANIKEKLEEKESEQ